MHGHGDPALRSSIKIAISTKRDLNAPLADSDETLLLRAIACRDDGAALLLLEHGASAEFRTASGEYPLKAACSAGLTRVIKRLLHQGVPSLPPEQDCLHQFPFVVACRNAHLDVCEQLLHAQQSPERRGRAHRRRERANRHPRRSGESADASNSSECATPSRAGASETSPSLSSPASTAMTTPSFNTVSTPSFSADAADDVRRGNSARSGSGRELESDGSRRMLTCDLCERQIPTREFARHIYLCLIHHKTWQEYQTVQEQLRDQLRVAIVNQARSREMSGEAVARLYGGAQYWRAC